ncbi:MAG: hypothetical protein QW203_05685 [Thermoplasmatales archaeon]
MRGIYTYKITLSNTTSTATPPNLQVRLNINFASLVSNINADLGNIRFSSDQAGNNLLYAWLESAPQGTFTQGTNVSSYTSSNVWVNLGNNIIPANGSLTIYMQVLSSGTEFDGVYWGANPLWTSTYGQYDNGASVFPYYQRWGGLSSLPSNWGEVSGTVVTFASTYIKIAPAPSTSGWYGIYLNPIPSSLSSTTTVWEFYGNMYDGVIAGSYVGTSGGAAGNFAGYSFSEGDSPSNLIYLANNNGQFTFSTGYDDTNTNKTYTMQVSSGTSVSMFINNTLIYSTATATSESPTYFNFTVSNNGGGAPSSPQYIYWLRTRTYPPNGTDPVLISIQILILSNYTSASAPVPNWSALRGKPYVTVSAKGISNGLSNIPNDGADFGPDTPGTTTGGIMEAKEALPKVQNQQTLRMVPSGTIEIHFGGYPIKMTSPIIFYDDEFINLISPDGFSQPVQPPNRPTVYIENTTGDPAFIMYPNPTVPSTAGSDLGNGIFRMDGISFMNTTSTGKGVFVFAPNPAGGSCSPNPSMFIGGVISVYDASEENFPLYISTNGNDDDIHIYDLTVIGATTATANMATISANHVNIEHLHLFSLSYTSTTTSIGYGFMCSLGAGGNMYIGVLDIFSYGANGVFNALSATGVSGGTPIVIDEFYDETSGVQNNARDSNAILCSFSNRTDLFIGAITATGGAFGLISPYNVPVTIGTSTNPLITNKLLPTPTLTANPPVSATVYQNTNLYDIRIYLPAYATTSGTAGSVAIALGSTSTPSTIGTKFINGSTSSSATEIIELVVPAGWYYEFTATGVTFGTATVFPA